MFHCVHSTVRLVGESSSYQGRVEVFYNGAWGTICHDFWELPDAHVVCHQLGFEQALAALRSAEFGEGTGVIWLDDLECAGNETAISECGHKGWRVTDCVHNQDASVICMPKGEIKYYMCKLFETKKHAPCQLIIIFFLNRFST